MIYLLHSTVRLGTPGRGGACHYLGHTADNRLEERLHEHMSGRSRIAIIRAFVERGADLILARVWDGGTPALERYLKRAGHIDELCPICRVANGKAQPNVQGLLPLGLAPLSVSHLKRHRRASGGAWLAGRLTISNGRFRVGQPLERTTLSPGVLERVNAVGGMPLGATVPAKPSAGASAGTRQPSGSTPRTSKRGKEGG